MGHLNKISIILSTNYVMTESHISKGPDITADHTIFGWLILKRAFKINMTRILGVCGPMAGPRKAFN